MRDVELGQNVKARQMMVANHLQHIVSLVGAGTN